MTILLPPVQEQRQAFIPSAESEDGRWVSEAVYWEHYYDHPYFNYEWNAGILEEVPMSDLQQYTLYSWFIDLIKQYLRVHPIGLCIALETGFKLTPRGGRKSIRKPDLGVVLHSNPQPLHPSDKSYHGIFDLCIESLSDSTQREVERDTIHKKREYARAGVQEYYILDPSSQHMAFYRLTSLGVYAHIQPTIDGVIQSMVLPGFQFRLSDLRTQPSQFEMANDEVYRGYMVPEYQEMQRQAKRERERAERMAARLRALGIDPDQF